MHSFQTEVYDITSRRVDLNIGKAGPMSNRKRYWKEHPNENERMNSFARLVIGQAETGPELARCAQLLVGSGLGSELVVRR
jgi:hypothetical protein